MFRELYLRMSLKSIALIFFFKLRLVLFISIVSSGAPSSIAWHMHPLMYVWISHTSVIIVSNIV